MINPVQNHVMSFGGQKLTGVAIRRAKTNGQSIQPPRTPDRRLNSTFMLIAPSKSFETQLAGALELSHQDHFHVSPWNVHRLLVADSLQGWPDYMASLEKQLKEQVGHS